MSFPPLSERVRDMLGDMTLGGDVVATLFAIGALAIGVVLLIAYSGMSASAWRWWLGL